MRPFFSPIAAILLSVPASAANAEIRIGTAGPMTGPIAWFGEQYVRGAGLAVEDLNARGGVLGQKVDLIVGDDYCDPDQAVSTARKLISDGVVLVVGHFCSHSSIPASKVYEEADILQIAPGSAAAQLTDQGRRNVFRVCGRDDRQGTQVADYLAAEWADKEIAEDAGRGHRCVLFRRFASRDRADLSPIARPGLRR
jgi:branched-chain amino acid transport system substrate-binding protein